MKRERLSPLAVVVPFVLSLLVTGCASQLREMQHVAKDWSAVIRASQVIPVYPLTEDLVPGDVFVTGTTGDQEEQRYRRRGFLPLDRHMARLEGLDYRQFYQRAFLTDGDRKPPYQWIFPAPGDLPKEPEGGPPAANGPHHRAPTLWSNAPRAFFPTYTFTVRRDHGARIALPLKSVPLAINLLNSDEAAGSVTLADAYSFGVSYAQLREALETWRAANEDVLDQMRARSRKPVFVRVVDRVYLTGSVDVSISSTRIAGAGLLAGAKAPAMLDAEPLNLETYQQKLETLNETIGVGETGGSVRVQQFSQRSITAKETFDRPLVIGYVGLDFEILPGGELGPPLATQDNLLGTPEAKLGEPSPRQMKLGDLLTKLGELPADAQRAAFGDATACLSPAMKATFDELVGKGTPPARAYSIARNTTKTSGAGAAITEERQLSCLNQALAAHSGR